MDWLIAHLIGDFIIQNDWMADGKKKCSAICLFHVSTYMCMFAIMTDLNIIILFTIGLQHFLQDRWGFVVWFMNKTGKSKFAAPPMAPWSIIIVDNIFHITFIYLLLKYWE